MVVLDLNRWRALCRAAADAADDGPSVLQLQDGTDRRARVVHLTKEGRKVITRVYADHAADMERLASKSLTKDERETLIRLLKQIGYEAAGSPAKKRARRDENKERMK